MRGGRYQGRVWYGTTIVDNFPGSASVVQMRLQIALFDPAAIGQPSPRTLEWSLGALNNRPNGWAEAVFAPMDIPPGVHAVVYLDIARRFVDVEHVICLDDFTITKI